MTDNLKRFLEYVSTDNKLVSSIPEMSREEIVRVAADAGIQLTDRDFEEARSSGELLDDELVNVVGGGKCGCVWCGGGNTGDGYKKCSCCKNGSGKFDDGCERCSCAAFGGGVDS